MKDFLGNELSLGDKVAYISTYNKSSLDVGIVYSMGTKRLHVHRGLTLSYEELIKIDKEDLNLGFKWNTQVIKI